jgi:hypothetical protein
MGRVILYKKLSKGIFLLLFLFCKTLTAQYTMLPTSIAKAKLEEKSRLERMIASNLQLPLADSAELQWQSAFWAMEFMQYKPAFVLKKVKMALDSFSNYSDDFKNALLQLVYANYAQEYIKDIEKIIERPLAPKQFAVCSEYLLRNNKSNFKKIKSLLTKNYAAQQDNAILNALSLKLTEQFDKRYSIDFLKSLLKNEFLPNQTVVISLQNKNRDYPGIALIRKPDGELLIVNDTVFYVAQLARSTNNLPYYISNGNSPQGLYRINGTASSTNSHIGPTSNLQLCMPFECAVQDFFDTPIADSLWNNDIYNTLFPISLQKKYHLPIQESAIAGKAGRTEIIAHGTTVNINYYKNKPYYGLTPTMGCIATKEIWDYKNGQRVYSDQQKLTDAFLSTGRTKGYLFLINIKDSPEHITLNDFYKIINSK